MQVAADWMLVPAARNLHWRYQVLHSAFMVCKQKVAPGESLQQNLDELLTAVRKIWLCIAKNTVVINERKKNINGNIGMLFSADGVTAAEKTILRAYLNTTENIAGCQAIRRKIGHCCFGMRTVYGETIFVTVSPNRRHSSMILKMSRARRNDTSLKGDDPVARARRRFCDKDVPRIFSHKCYSDDAQGEATVKEIPLPALWIRQACNAQDPISSCHHYLFFMRVILPGIFGLRMCFLCPDCNRETCEYQYHRNAHPCSDYLGCNSKLMGGYAGIATAMAFATEYQGEATPHGHGFVSLANMYQHHTLEEIGNMIEHNSQKIAPEVMLERITKFCEHLQREDHFDHDQHDANLEELEKQFHANNDGPQENIFLSVRSSPFFTTPKVHTLWQTKEVNERLMQEINEEAERFEHQFRSDVQFIFSRVQHHWHKLDDKGIRVPLIYCCLKGKRKQFLCKAGFPKKVLRHRDGKLKVEKYRCRIVCQGVAAEMNLKTSGRRNALGSILGRRRCNWFSVTSAVLANVARSNTNVQCNYRVPITSFTHDKDCTSAKCCDRISPRALCMIAQRAMKQMTGYFGGYISKRPVSYTHLTLPTTPYV